MGTALQVYEKVTDPIAFTREYATAIAAMTGCSIQQAPGLALDFLCSGKALSEFVEENHFIEGRKSMKSQAMLAKFRRQIGGKHEEVARTPTRAAVKLIDRDGESCINEFTLHDALLSRWPWRKWRESVPAARAALASGQSAEQVAAAMMDQMKDSWATPTDQKTMLWHRCVRDAIASFKPELVVDIYTPEEIEDLRVEHENVTIDLSKQLVPDADVRDADFTPVTVVGEVASDSQAAADSTHVTEPLPASVEPYAAGSIKRSQIERLRFLFDRYGISPDDQTAALARRGAKAMHSLSQRDGQEIIDKLEAMKSQLLAGN